MSMSKLVALLAAVLLAAIPAGLAQAQARVEGTGTAVFSNGESLSDRITYTMAGVTRPAKGTAYEGWLLSDDGSKMLSTGVMDVAVDGSVNHTLESSRAVLIALDEQTNSGQKGWASLTAKGKQTEVVVSISPGRLESELNHVHTGRCGRETLGGVVYPLTAIAAGPSVTTINVSLASLRTGNFAVNLHQKGAAGVYTACGNIPRESEAVTILIGEQSNSGQRGWATLTSSGTTTSVVFTVSGGTLEPELAHIHTGRCGREVLGRVVHPLTSVAAGASASRVNATLAALRNGDFALNIHQKGAAGVYVACGNIPAGGSFYTGENLIKGYSKVAVTQEPVPDTDPKASATVVFSHQIPKGAIDHIRHLLNNWPDDKPKGILTNLKEQLDIAIRHANLGRDSADLAGVLLHARHLVNIIEGEKGKNFDKAAGNPGDGIGVLTHAADRKHAGFAAAAAPGDEVIRAAGALVEIDGKNAEDWATKARDVALDIVKQNNFAIGKLLLGPGGNTVISSLEAARSGFDTDSDGTIASVAGEAGAEQAYVDAQAMATQTLMPGPLPGPVAPARPPAPVAPVGPTIGLPGVGDASVPLAAPVALMVGVVLVGTGGYLILRRRSRRGA